LCNQIEELMSEGDDSVDSFRTWLLLTIHQTVLSQLLQSICACSEMREHLFLQRELSLRDRRASMERLYDITWTYCIINHGPFDTGRRLQQLCNVAFFDEVKLRDMQSGVVPAICAACRNLDPRLWERRQTGTYSTYVSHIQRASSGCSACTVLL
jgi:hypothetical protein